MTSGRLPTVGTSASDHGYQNLDPQSYTAHRLVRAFLTGFFVRLKVSSFRSTPPRSIFISRLGDSSLARFQKAGLIAIESHGTGNGLDKESIGRAPRLSPP
jgi:hypothetical protein